MEAGQEEKKKEGDDPFAQAPEQAAPANAPEVQASPQAGGAESAGAAPAGGAAAAEPFKEMYS
jgi:hypothetical protein